MFRLGKMKQGYTAIGVLIIVGLVLGLGVLFVLSNSSSPTGYAGSGVPLTGAVTAFVPQITACSSDADCTSPETCQYYEEYDGYYCGNGCSVSCDSVSDCTGEDFEDGCCDSDEFAGCQGSCVCISPCEEGDFCETDAEDSIQCGGAIGGDPSPQPCIPTEPDGENGGCDCNDDGCPEGAFCSSFGVASHPFDDPCGTGSCVIIDSEEGSVFGQCACEDKSCELLDAEDFEGEFDQCPDTVQCEEGSTCSNHDDCGGIGIGKCKNGICDCECVSWAPCEDDSDCGVYGEGGDYGRCIAGADGALECMCTDDLGCSPLDCIPGETPCSGHPLDCGGDGEDNCVDNICEACGTNPCELPCLSGDCTDIDTPLTQEDCDEVAAEIASSCTVDTDDNECDCDNVPESMCIDTCYSTEGGLIGNCL